MDDATQSMIDNLAAKTGRTLADWVQVVKARGEAKHGALVSWLKAEHGLGHGYANLIAHEALGGRVTAEPSMDLVDAQYAGKKAALRPILDAVLAVVATFGEVEIAPKKTSVSLRRSKQFALVEPKSASRVDVCIQLKGDPAGPRLQASKSTMTSHVVAVGSVEEIDDELIGWLRAAWDRA